MTVRYMESRGSIGRRVRAGALRKALTGSCLLASLLIAAAPSFAQGPACEREGLEAMVTSYLAAQTAGEATKIPMADWMTITEQGEIGSLATGMLSLPQKIDFSRSLYDLKTCATFTELVITDPAHPYVIGARLQNAGHFSPIAADRVNEVELTITDKDDWLFNAKKTLAFSKAEDWGVIPEADRDSREVIMAAANAYLDSFNDKTKQVPWGTPCARLEGGLYSGKGGGAGAGEDRCDGGVPTGVKIIERRYVVDETIGAVAVSSLFGTNKLPDVHTFRIEKGKIRYVHTITVCKTANCGLTLSDDIKQRLQD
jgi:hypothetical protein